MCIKWFVIFLRERLDKTWALLRIQQMRRLQQKPCSLERRQTGITHRHNAGGRCGQQGWALGKKAVAGGTHHLSSLSRPFVCLFVFFLKSGMEFSLELELELRGSYHNPGISTSYYSPQMKILGSRGKSATLIWTWEAAAHSLVG